MACSAVKYATIFFNRAWRHSTLSRCVQSKENAVRTRMSMGQYGSTGHRSQGKSTAWQSIPSHPFYVTCSGLRCLARQRFSFTLRKHRNPPRVLSIQESRRSFILAIVGVCVFTTDKENSGLKVEPKGRAEVSAPATDRCAGFVKERPFECNVTSVKLRVHI